MGLGRVGPSASGRGRGLPLLGGDVPGPGDVPGVEPLQDAADDIVALGEGDPAVTGDVAHAHHRSQVVTFAGGQHAELNVPG